MKSAAATMAMQADASVDVPASESDRRFMAAAVRYAWRNVGRTGTNPSVATLIVRDDGDGRGRRIVGRAVTAFGGRPHAEPLALAEAGDLACGATAYVTLEPCAHHGHTPPCADALVAAGIARVVSATADPDPRVDGKGLSILRAGGLDVTPRTLATEAREPVSGYLMRQGRQRPHVTLKLALSADGKIGREGSSQVRITGPIANAQTHLERMRHDAILVGIRTVDADDPRLDCRLPGLARYSPRRIVLDPSLRVSPDALVVSTARTTPTTIAALPGANPERRRRLEAAGVRFVACEADPRTGLVALPDLLEDLAGMGVSSVLVEGGGRIAESFLKAGLVDRLILIEGAGEIGMDGIASPIRVEVACARFSPARDYRFGEDRWFEFTRKAA